MPRKSKSCVGCSDQFLTYRNYDYCQSCAINNNRYVQNQCSKCGDGSGQVKFKNQKPRPCKLCYLTKNSMNKKLIKLNPEKQFWNEVEEKSHSLIANLVEKILPISAIPSVFKLKKDTNYQNLLKEDLPNSYQESEEYQEKIAEQSWTEEDVKYVAQDLTCNYFDLVVKNLVDWLSPHPAFESCHLAQIQYE
jgi:hypothetical protein